MACPENPTHKEWHSYLEGHLHKLIMEIEYLIEKDISVGDSIQRTYLYRAKHALKDGVSWYDFFRKKHGDLPDYPRKVTPKGG
jgi:hypothetical protein